MKRISALLIFFTCCFSPRALSAEVAENDAIMDHRPAVAKRCFRSKVVDAKIESMRQTLMAINPKLWYMFQNCYPNTLDTTVKYHKKGKNAKDLQGIKESLTFVITGDIDAMWLRDSGAQVWTYLPYVNEDPELKDMIRGVIREQFRLILRDPYANAFLEDPDASPVWASDQTLMKNGIHERKYEIDSLCYPLRLAYGYWKLTGDDTIFDDLFLRTLTAILDVFQEQQRMNGNQHTSYTFVRTTPALHDTTSNYGYGHPCKPCGLICSFFRPSDDSTIMPYLVPSNFFAESVLRKMAEVLGTMKTSETTETLQQRCFTMANQVHDALMKYAVVVTRKYGPVYAFEVDGFGGRVLMDDANAPSLLSLPYLCPELVSIDDPIYQNTRRMIWSDDNPYFFGEGIDGVNGPEIVSGIGSQHTGLDNVWPMSLIMKGLTSNNLYEQQQLVQQLVATDGGTGFMHESFNPSDPSKFTRSWFAWANGLFGELVIRAYGSK